MDSQLLKAILKLLDQKSEQAFDLESLAEATGFSKYYLCRAFHAATGEPLIRYLRRLALARGAERLRSGQRIIDVAFECGYESQEAFHRAFSKMFGVTPKAFQKGRHHPSLLIKKPWGEQLMPSSEPTMREEERGAFDVQGIGGEYSYERFADIVDLWERFHQRYRVSGPTYGVTLAIEGQPERFLYYACAAQGKLEQCENLETIHVPAQRYQVFEHRGPATDLMRTFNYIWGVWLPESGARLSGIDFECYPMEYNPLSFDARAEIFVPIVEG